MFGVFYVSDPVVSRSLFCSVQELCATIITGGNTSVKLDSKSGRGKLDWIIIDSVNARDMLFLPYEWNVMTWITGIEYERTKWKYCPIKGTVICEI